MENVIEKILNKHFGPLNKAGNQFLDPLIKAAAEDLIAYNIGPYVERRAKHAEERHEVAENNLRSGIQSKESAEEIIRLNKEASYWNGSLTAYEAIIYEARERNSKMLNNGRS